MRGSWRPRCTDAVDLGNQNLYREIVNLQTTSELLADPVKRRGIVAFVRALLVAAERFRTKPDEVRPTVAQAMGVDQSLVAQFWQFERFPGMIVSDLLDVLVEEEAWLAATNNRTPRTREQLATLIDTSVLAEAMAP